jgi:DNA-binding NtrC family response regulator
MEGFRRNGMKTSILVVEDDEAILRVLSIVLRREGYDVTTASTGKEAIEKTTEKPYDLVLTDLNLPDINGQILLQLISRRNPLTKKIILTGSSPAPQSSDSDKEPIKYLMKPLGAEDLLNAVKETLSGK